MRKCYTDLWNCTYAGNTPKDLHISPVSDQLHPKEKESGSLGLFRHYKGPWSRASRYVRHADGCELRPRRGEAEREGTALARWEIVMSRSFKVKRVRSWACEQQQYHLAEKSTLLPDSTYAR